MSDASIETKRYCGISHLECVTSLVGWGGYIVALSIYCYIHQLIIKTAPVDYSGSLWWALKEWSVWLILTPAVFKYLRTSPFLTMRHWRQVLPYVMGLLAVSLSVRIAIDSYSDNETVAGIIVVHFPRHLAALLAVFIVWYFILRERGPVGVSSESSQEDKGQIETLLVSKGNDQCLLKMEDIHFLSAAGNYVEVFSQQEQFLIRATMKQLEGKLPAHQFLRTHRSHIINIKELDRIKVKSSGNGTVLLKCGRQLALSKRYKQQLQEFKLC